MNWDIVLGAPLGQGGLERVIAAAGRTLRRRDHGVRILQTQPSAHPEWAHGLPVIYYDAGVLGGVARFNGEPQLLRWALGYRQMLEAGGKPDVILAAHTPVFSLVARLAAGIEGDAPTVLSWLHGPVASYGDPSALRCADAHLAISQAVEAELRALQWGQPVFHVGNPVQLAVAPVPRPRATAEFVFLGRLAPEKRLGFLLQALSGIAAPWRLSVFGDGPQASELEAAAENLGIAARVVWHGWLRDPWQAVRQASALVLPSEYEGFGVAAAEALARGIPVITSDSGGPEEFLQDGGGWIYPKDDVEQLRTLLAAIAAGELPLPDAAECRAQVRGYAAGLVVDRIEAAALAARAHAAAR